MPLPSPTTTRAVKLNLRPPCTNLATRLIVTTRSRYAVPFSGPAPRRSSRRSRRSPPPPAPRRCAAAIRSSSSVVGSGRGSQRQSALTGAVGEGGNPAVVGITRAIEYRGVHAGLGRAFREQHANLLSLGCLVAGCGSDRHFQGRGRRERVARRVIDELGKRVPRRARNYQPRPQRAALDLLADAQMPPLPRGYPRRGPACDPDVGPGLGARHVLLTSLSDLAADLLALVAHALALVGIGLAELADVGGNLAHLLLVDALNDEPGGRLDPEADPVRGCHWHRVTEAKGELQVAAPGLDPVADADDFQGLPVALGDARHHVGDQGPGQPVQRADLAFVTGPRHGDNAVILLDLDRRGHLQAQLPLGALDVDLAAVDGDVDTARDGDRQPSDSRHAGSLPDVGEDFPAYALLLSLLVGHQAGRRRDDCDAEAAEHSRQVVLACVHPEAGLGHALEARDGALPGRAELQRDHQVPANLGVLHLPAGDVALLLEDLRDVRLDLGVRHRHGVVVRRIGIAQTGQHVCDRVGHSHGLMALLAVVSTVFAFVVCNTARTFGVVSGRRGAQVGCYCMSCCQAAATVGLPAGLGDAGQLAAVRHRPEADPTQAEPLVDGARAAAPGAPGVRAHLELG